MSQSHRILGVSSTASLKEIKRAYREKAKLYHPDVNPNSAELFKQINAAYQNLLDVYQRYEKGNSTHGDPHSSQSYTESTVRPDGKPASGVGVGNRFFRVHNDNGSGVVDIKIPTDATSEECLIIVLVNGTVFKLKVPKGAKQGFTAKVGKRLFRLHLDDRNQSIHEHLRNLKKE